MKYKDFIENLERSILSLNDPNFDEINSIVNNLLKNLYHRGKIMLKEDQHLTGGALEIRVDKIFKSMGFNIREGRQNNLEDFIIYPSDNFKTQYPLVIEVKSGKNSCVARDDLRQLDDWVFELSGEEKIRRRRPSDNKATTFYISAGFPPGPDTHPTPHKGVLIFNGPIGVPFIDRAENCLHPNDIEYVNKRFFCILSFQSLIEISNRFENGEINREQIWESLNNCSGLWKQDMC